MERCVSERTRLPADYVRIYASTHTEIGLALRRQLDQLLLRDQGEHRQEGKAPCRYHIEYSGGLLVYLHQILRHLENYSLAADFFQAKGYLLGLVVVCLRCSYCTVARICFVQLAENLSY